MDMTHVLTSIWNMFEGLSAGTTSGKIAITLFATLTAFYSPIAALLICCFVFTAVDMFYGIKVAKKFNKKITSNKSWNGTLTKLMDEWIIISLARLLEWAVLGDEQGVFVLTGGATVVIGLTELWSILENLNTLNPKGPWKALGKFLKKKGEDYIGTELDLKYNDDNSNNPKKPIAEVYNGGDTTDGMVVDGSKS